MTQRITSLQNEYIKSLCLLHHASERRKTGLFLIEGAKLCEEALRSGWPVEQCLVTEKEAEITRCWAEQKETCSEIYQQLKWHEQAFDLASVKEAAAAAGFSDSIFNVRR